MKHSTKLLSEMRTWCLSGRERARALAPATTAVDLSMARYTTRPALGSSTRTPVHSLARRLPCLPATLTQLELGVRSAREASRATLDLGSKCEVKRSDSVADPKSKSSAKWTARWTTAPRLRRSAPAEAPTRRPSSTPPNTSGTGRRQFAVASFFGRGPQIEDVGYKSSDTRSSSSSDTSSNSLTT